MIGVWAKGTQVGGYRVERELGRGGMGVVYLAREDVTGREVALKTIWSAATLDEETLRRFRREGEALARLSHPNLTRVHARGEREGLPYLVLELLGGGSLADRLARGPLDWREAATTCARLARGLAAIHEAGLVHRDLKPGNVLFSAEGVPKITDFGLVRSSERSVAGTLTKSGEVLGSPAFMAPEQANGVGVGPAADVYGLGATLFAALTGRPPFAQSGVALLKAILHERPPSPGELNASVPPRLGALTLRLLAKPPEARGSAKDAAAALEALLESGPKGAKKGVPAASGSRRTPVVAVALGLIAAAGGTALVLRAPTPERGPGSAPSPAVSPVVSRSTPGKTVSPPPPRTAVEELRQAEKESRIASYDRPGTLSLLHHAVAQALASDPGGEFWLRATTLAIALQAWPDASRASERLVAIRPRSAPAHAQRAEALLRTAALEAALAEAEESTKLDPGCEPGWVIEADLLRRLERKEPAREAVEAARKLDPNDGRAIELQLQIDQWWVGNPLRADLERVDPLRAGVAYVEPSYHSGADVGRDLDELRLQHPWNAEVLTAQARLAVLPDKDKNPKRAIELATRALDLDPSEAGAWDAIASAHFILGEFDASIEAAARTITFDRSATDTRKTRGRAENARSLYSDAEKTWTEVIAREGEPSAALAERAHTRIAQGNLAGALEDVERSLLSSPPNALALRARASIHRRRGELDAAVADQTLAIQATPSSELLFERAAMERLRGHDAAWKADLRAGIDLLPNEPTMLGGFAAGAAEASLWLDLPEQALTFATRAIEHGGDTGFARAIRGTAYVELGRLDEAAEDAKRAHALDSDQPRTWALEASLALARRDPDGAEAALEHARERSYFKDDVAALEAKITALRAGR